MKKKNILVLDVETAGSFGSPMVYDIGYIIADLHGNILEKRSYCIREIFVYRKDLMESAYYAEKVPQYREEIHAGQRKTTSFYEARQELLFLMKKYNVGEAYAYNMTFDHNALNKTLAHLTGGRYKHFFPISTKLYCIWSMACDTIFQHKTFRKIALRECWFTASGAYFSSSAETAYRYIRLDYDFAEEHKGIDDVLIEYEVLLHVRRQKKKMSKTPGGGFFRKCKI